MKGSGADARVADEVVDEIRQAGGIAVVSHDSVATPDGGAAIVQSALDPFGRVDAVVSNAGIYETAPLEEVTPERWRAMLRVHLDGGFYLAQPAFRAMKAQGYGRFVFIASQMGAFGEAPQRCLWGGESRPIGLTNVVAIEGAAHGILANSVLPIGYSRMVTESIGDRTLSEVEEAFFKSIEPDASCRSSSSSPAGPATRRTTTSRRLRAGSPGRSWGSVKGGSPTPAARRRRLMTSPRTTTNLSDQSFTVPMSAYDEIIGLCGRSASSRCSRR